MTLNDTPVTYETWYIKRRFMYVKTFVTTTQSRASQIRVQGKVVSHSSANMLNKECTHTE